LYTIVYYKNNSAPAFGTDAILWPAVKERNTFGA
jgi:hypothetical protein